MPPIGLCVIALASTSVDHQLSRRKGVSRDHLRVYQKASLPSLSHGYLDFYNATITPPKLRKNDRKLVIKKRKRERKKERESTN